MVPKPSDEMAAPGVEGAPGAREGRPFYFVVVGGDDDIVDDGGGNPCCRNDGHDDSVGSGVLDGDDGIAYLQFRRRRFDHATALRLELR